MTNGPRRKFICKKRKTVALKEKDIFYDLSYVDKKNRNGSQYLYVDPTFMMEASCNDLHRLKGGFGQEEIYYDCLPCSNEEIVGSGYDVGYVENIQGILQQQMQVLDVIAEIRNAKEFKGLLKQMACTSNILYRTFKQAYSNTKKNKTNRANTFCMENECCKIKDRGDINNFDIINVEVSTCKPNDCSNINCNTTKKEKPKKNKKREKSQKHKDENPICYAYDFCPQCKPNEQTKICPICLGVIEDELFVCSEKLPAQNSYSEKSKPLTETPNEDDKNCLTESNVCEQYDKELENLEFCDRCAVLRGEMPAPSPPKKIENTSETSDKSTQISQEISVVKLCSNTKVPKLPKQCQPQSSKHILNINPVCLTIPLKLQVDGQNCQTRFLETEIVMETFAGQNKSSAPKTKTINKSALPIAAIVQDRFSAVKSDNVRDKFGSDIFYSCQSNSGIIRPTEMPKSLKEKPFNDLVEIMKKKTPTIPETTEPKSRKAIEPKETRVPPVTKPLAIKTEFTQTTEPYLPAVLPPQVDPKIKANKLRAELLEEVKTVLAQTTTLLALKSLKEGRRFSLPATLQVKEAPNVRPARHSFPDNYKAMPLALPSTPFVPDLPPIPPIRPPQQATPIPPPIKTEIEEKPATSVKVERLDKPEPPPKPAPQPKPVQFATAQTDSSGIKPSGHFRRNDFRNEIQEELRDLLEPNSTKSSQIYDSDEREQILLDLNKLFHPGSAGLLPKQVSRENALQDIRYLVEPNVEKPQTSRPQDLKRTDSQESIIDSIRYILNPKMHQKTRKKRYSKETKDKILEDLHILLRPRKRRTSKDQETRASILGDLIFMLDTGIESESHFRPPRSGAPPDNSPGPSNSKQVRQERQRLTTNELKESFKADLIHLLESTNLPQSTNSRNVDAKHEPPTTEDKENQKNN